jgi:hypothetical protein
MGDGKIVVVPGVRRPGDVARDVHAEGSEDGPGRAVFMRRVSDDDRAAAGLLASRMPGLLDDIEKAVAIAETAQSVETAAEEVRPADEVGALTLTSALRWLRPIGSWRPRSGCCPGGSRAAPQP